MNGDGSEGLRYALGAVHQAEARVHELDLLMADRHRVEHEVHHVALDLAAWSRTNLRLIAAVAASLDCPLPGRAGPPGTATGEPDTPHVAGPSLPVVLLEDLATLFLAASASSLAWEMLAQLAQATRRADLAQLAGDCHPRTLRQIRWANTMIKTLAPQALSSL